MKQVFAKLKLHFLLWFEERRINKKVNSIEFPKFSITKQVTQEAYIQSKAKIKKKIEQLIKAKSKEEYERVLGELKDLQDIAIKSDDPEYIKFIDNLKRVYIYKVEPSKNEMIEKRIKTMYELQSDKVNRQKLREQRNKNRS